MSAYGTGDLLRGVSERFDNLPTESVCVCVSDGKVGVWMCMIRQV